jgi:hypothetical protein
MTLARFELYQQVGPMIETVHSTAVDGELVNILLLRTEELSAVIDRWNRKLTRRSVILVCPSPLSAFE